MAGYRQIQVDGSPVGLRGLDEVLEALRLEGRQAGEEGLGLEVVKRLRGDNYIPPSARAAFAAALEQEYAAHLQRQAQGKLAPKKDPRARRGQPSEVIPWFPTINEDLCNGCGACLKLCSTHCLAPKADGKVWVADPFACVAGCSSCAAVCKPKAITFPPRSMLEVYRRR